MSNIMTVFMLLKQHCFDKQNKLRIKFMVGRGRVEYQKCYKSSSWPIRNVIVANILKIQMEYQFELNCLGIFFRNLDT